MKDEPDIDFVNVVRFNLFGYVDEDAAAEFIQSLWLQDSADDGAVWEIAINTEGGDMEAGTAIYSEICSYSERSGGNHFVITKVRGQAASCGSLILQAGDHRMAGKMDYIMLHEPLMTFQDATMQRVADELSQARSWTKNFVSVVAERSEQPCEFFARNISSGRDWWLSSDEALELGLIDEIA